RSNRSTRDAIAQVLHSTLSQHGRGRGSYVKLLFTDYSSAFNTIVLHTLSSKLQDLGLNTSLCNWVQGFLTGRLQMVWMGCMFSSTLTQHQGPPGMHMSLLLYSLSTFDSVTTHATNSMVKFADDTVMVSLISHSDNEVDSLSLWCQDNHLSLNVDKTKELVMDFRRQQGSYTTLQISGTPV
ncbi:hypothetical protein LDENG_00074750, partial [Lucifuga dentata]